MRRGGSHTLRRTLLVYSVLRPLTPLVLSLLLLLFLLHVLQVQALHWKSYSAQDAERGSRQTALGWGRGGSREVPATMLYHYHAVERLSPAKQRVCGDRRARLGTTYAAQHSHNIKSEKRSLADGTCSHLISPSLSHWARLLAHEIQSAPSRQHQPGRIWKLNVTDKLSEIIFAVDFLKTFVEHSSYCYSLVRLARLMLVMVE